MRASVTDNSGRSADSAPVYVQVGQVSGTRLVRGPYLQNATPTAVTIRWRTDWFTDSLVRLSVGVEAVRDLMDDLEAAFEAI